MKFNIVFHILAAILLVLAGLTVVLWPPMAWLYLVCEALALLFTMAMYYSLVRPVSAILLGRDLLVNGDFGSRLVKVGQLDAEKLVDLFNNMMMQIKTERLRRHEQNYFLEMLINASPLGILTLDFNGLISQANPAAVRLLGANSYDEVHGRSLKETGGEIASTLWRMEEDEVQTLRLADTMIYRCTRLSFLDSGLRRPFFLIESLTDEVMKAEKSAYEKVIRMIAHEVNNTVAGSISLLEAISTVLASGDDELADALESCRDRISSMNAFITSYANLVRIPQPELVALDINALLRTSMPFFESIAADHDIRVVSDLWSTPVAVAADPVLMEQVLVNVVKNAVESIGCGGEIVVSTVPGRLTVADNGPGISPEASRHIFSPFFSTKAGGQGLGLMFVGEVLRRHGFRFSLATSPDGLTRFTINF